MSRVLQQDIDIGGDLITLGDLHLKRLTKPTIRQVMQVRLEEYKEDGRKGESQVNRELSYLSNVIKWGLEHYDEFAGLGNPCHGITRFKENVRDRYVTDGEYLRQLQIAGAFRDYLPIVFEITYLTATRGIEALNLKFSDIIQHPEDGRRCIKTRRRKGSKDTYIFLSPRFEAAIDAARELHKKRKVAGLYIVPGPGRSTTGKLKKGTLDSAMQDLKNHMIEAVHGDLFWTLHDLKRKGISDAEDKKIAGQSPAMQARYDTKIHAFEPPA